MRRFTDQRRKGTAILICISLCMACMGSLPAATLSVQAAGMAYLPNGELAGQDVIQEEPVVQPENLYFPLVDEYGQYELDTYEEKDLFVTITGKLNYYMGGYSLGQIYQNKTNTNPKYFQMEDGTDCFLQLMSLMAGQEYAVVTDEIKSCLMNMAGILTGQQENWPMLCYCSEYRVSKECVEVASVSGSAIIDVSTTPLYIDLSRPLSRACHGYSLKNYHDSLKDTHPEFFGTQEEDYYANLVDLAGENGLCPVTEEIKKNLENLSKTFLQDESGETWWQFCFYYRDKLTEREEFHSETIFLYGNMALADEDALVLVLTGNGFGIDSTVKYIAEASSLYHALIDNTVYGECANAIKIYFLDSNGVESKKKLKRFLKENPAVDYSIVIENSMDNRESREDRILTCTMNSESKNLLIQDLSRCIAGWNGSGFADSALETTQNWHHTGDQCKMQQAEADDFCEFCKEEIRRGISNLSDAALLYYQPKGKIFLEGCEPEDLLKYIYVRKNGEKIQASQMPDQFYITYYDKDGSVCDATRTAESGKYKIRVVFLGNGMCDPIMTNTTYHVDVIVRYDSQGGSPVEDTYETVGEKYGSSLPVTERDGYTFKGWYTEIDGGQKVEEDSIVTAGTTLYARWLKNCDVTFNGNGKGVSLSETSMTVASGEKVGTLPTAARKGYVFKGWYTAATGGKKITSSTAITKKTTFFARWAKVTVDKVSNVKLTAAKKAVKTSYQRISGAAGYEIRYSTTKSMTKYKTKTVKGTVLTLNNLTSRKIYYVKVRAYKTDSLGKKVYGAWSVKKTCKTK